MKRASFLNIINKALDQKLFLLFQSISFLRRKSSSNMRELFLLEEVISSNPNNELKFNASH
jgi:hypothetical protein